MKLIMYLFGLITVAVVTGCESHHYHHHDAYRGGAYDGYYEGYGTESYPARPYYDQPRRDWQYDRDHWRYNDR
jgi:hypothetical protein